VRDATLVRFDEIAPRVAGAIDRLALRPGVRVAIDAPSSIETVIAIVAAITSGATIVPIHPRLTAVEKRDLVARARADLVLDAVALRDVTAAIAPILRAKRSIRASRWPRSSPPAPPARPSSRSSPAAPSTPAPRRARATSAGATTIAGSPACRSVTSAASRSSPAASSRIAPSSRCRASKRARCSTPSSIIARPSSRSCRRCSARSSTPIHDDVLARPRAILVGGAACSPALLDDCARRHVAALTTYGLTERARR